MKRPHLAGPISNILDLEAVAKNPLLVVPGQPDASNLHTYLLLGHGARLDATAADPAPATSQEIDAIRRWIAERAPPVANDCAERQERTTARVAAEAAAYLARLPPQRRGSQRFVSLAHLFRACDPPQAIATYRQAVAKLVTGLTRTAQPVAPVVIGTDGLVIAVDLAELGWVAEQWELIGRGYPLATAAQKEAPAALKAQTGTPVPIINADWLAHAAGSEPVDGQLLGLPDRRVNLERLPGFEIVTALAQRYAGPQGLRDIAAEAGLTPAELSARLGQVTGDARRLADAVRMGPISRGEAIELLAAAGFALAADAASPPPSVAALGRRALSIWPEKPSVAPGDPIAIHVAAGADCPLTIVSIDADERAVVVFPNDFQRDGLIKAGQRIELPPPGAPYRFRASKPGVETLIAMCAAAGSSVLDISHDFERQLFTLIGNWPAHLASALEPRSERAEREREPRRRGRKRRNEAPAAPVVRGPASIGAYAVTTFQVR